MLPEAQTPAKATADEEGEEGPSPDAATKAIQPRPRPRHQAQTGKAQYVCVCSVYVSVYARARVCGSQQLLALNSLHTGSDTGAERERGLATLL